MVYQQKMWQSYLVVIVLLVISGYAFVYRLRMPVENQLLQVQQVSNFEECASSGNPVAESNPRTCIAQGKMFTEGFLYNDAGILIVPDGVISGKVTIGPFCPVEKEGVVCNVPMDAYTSRIARLYDSTGTNVIEWRNINTDGTFEFTPPPGNYFIDVYPGGIQNIEKQKVEVLSAGVINVSVIVDTGIR